MIDFTATYWLAEGYRPWHGRIGNDAPEVKECKAIPREAGEKACDDLKNFYFQRLGFISRQ